MVFPKRHFSSVAAVPDVGLAYINGALEAAGHDSRVIDAAGEAMDKCIPLEGTRWVANGLSPEEVISRIRPDVQMVGISCMHSNRWIRDSQIISEVMARFQGVPVVLGGEHATACSEVILKQFPRLFACVLGEGDETILELVDAVSGHKRREEIVGISYRTADGLTVLGTRRSRIQELDGLRPSWRGVPLEKYFQRKSGINSFSKKSIPILTSRGCPFSCHFCTCSSMWLSKWISRSPESVIREIKNYRAAYGIEHVDCVDLTLGLNRKLLKKFAELLIEERLGISWALPIGTRIEGLDRDVLGLLAKSGLSRILFSPETGSPDTLRSIGKDVDFERLQVLARECVRLGIVVKIALVFGFPEQTKRDVWRTFLLLVRLARVGVNDIVCLSFVPYPGTHLYRELGVEYVFGSADRDIRLNNDIATMKSWSVHYSDRFLRATVLLFTGAFYLMQFLLRPVRVIGLLFRVFLKRAPLTNFESIIFQTLRSWAGKRRG